ncbi:MoaD/ThiS family protein [Desulforhopalus singaporensis]|uniref:Molybdopterin converting factor, small subunit n=1 Tax=Desulforhopalus singaporensis TaxID=91360 RepID=A0A1H0U6G5_9BACT|nr:MoaD/ThiS family protein [Desulforhopalus singaporensis]SDP61872.1 Molybdopterin converting factor, small subunit [Desulforhopalus singaporensis]
MARINVTVKLFAYFRENRFKISEQEIAPGTTVGDIVDSLDIDREEVGVLMINSRHTTFETPLEEANVLAIFPVVGGG